MCCYFLVTTYFIVTRQKSSRQLVYISGFLLSLFYLCPKFRIILNKDKRSLVSLVQK